MLKNSASVAASALAKQDYTVAEVTAETLSVMINERIHVTILRGNISFDSRARLGRAAVATRGCSFCQRSDPNERTDDAERTSLCRLNITGRYVSQPSDVLRADETTGSSCHHSWNNSIGTSLGAEPQPAAAFCKPRDSRYSANPIMDTRETHYV